MKITFLYYLVWQQNVYIHTHTAGPFYVSSVIKSRSIPRSQLSKARVYVVPISLSRSLTLPHLHPSRGVRIRTNLLIKKVDNSSVAANAKKMNYVRMETKIS